MRRTIIVVMAAASLVACSEDTRNLPGGGSGSSDATPGTEDALPSDAPAPDAMAGDAAPADVMGHPDAFVPDNGIFDADAPDATLDAGFMDADPPDTGPMSCGPIAQVASMADLAALAPAMWGRELPFSQRTLTGDIEATASFIIEASAFTRPTECTGPCASEPTLLSQRNNPAGIGTGPMGELITSPGAQFRMRLAVATLVPVGPFAQVQIEPACRAGCSADQRLCANDNACYTDGRSYCRLCLLRDSQICACVGPNDTTMPDGTDCTYVIGDIAFAGMCQAGECMRGR